MIDSRRVRVVQDVSTLPNVVFGNRGLVWWGIAGFIVIEGFTLAITAAVYLYLRKNYVSWPPEHTALPDLRLSSIGLLIYLLGIIPMRFAAKSAERNDRAGIRLWMIVCSVIAVGFVVLRWYEMFALNVRWDSNAYGSAAWAILGTHWTLLLLEAYETLGVTLIYMLGRDEPKHLTDVADNAMYWYFMILAWVPLYVLVFWSPRFM